MMHKEEKFNKVCLLVVDGFGIGEMNDTKIVRPLDVGSNTALHVIKNNPNLDFPSFRKLGLYDLLNIECNDINFINGQSELKHFGADSFYGHQEIMGTNPIKPEFKPFNYYLNEVIKILKINNIKYEIIYDNPTLILIENCFTIGDNIETDLGQAFNITADLNVLKFSEVVKIGKLIRKVIKVPRLIIFGSKETCVEKILDSVEIKQKIYIGVNAPKSGVYSKSYECIHLGYGIDYTKQCTYNLVNQGIEVSLIGKTADIITAQGAECTPGVDTEFVMSKIVEKVKKQKKGLIFANVQETDLSGHECDVEKFGKKLKIVDNYLKIIMDEILDETLLIVMADHGDDPCIGHAQHTREYVPLLIYHNNIKSKKLLDDSKTMANVGQTVYHILTGKYLEFGEVIDLY